MSEHVKRQEQAPSPETSAQQMGMEARPTDESAPKRNEKPAETSIGSIRSDIEHHALHAADTAPTVNERQAAHPSSTNIGADLHNQARYRLLKNVRQHLSMPERSLSKLVHQPVVDAASELGGKTVARPSGLLGGGICAFAGSLLFLYLSKHYGFRYNYLLFGLFFVSGFAVGLVIETLARLAYRLRQRV